MPGTPLIAFSIGDATVCSSVCAEAPGYVACTVTTGGAISGYCAIGSDRIAARPASTMNVARTIAKTGRSMKKRENIGPPQDFGLAPDADALSFAGSDAEDDRICFAAVDAGAARDDAAFAAASGPILTFAPGISFATPSTMTWSPGFNPDSITHLFAPSAPTQSPTTTGRGVATSLPSLSLPTT